MLDDNLQKEAANYYLPRDVKDWIERQAEHENRSPSNYLTTLIRRIRESGDPV